MRPPGIEPGSEPWQGPILPLNHGRKDGFGVPTRFLKVPLGLFAILLLRKGPAWTILSGSAPLCVQVMEVQRAAG